MKNQSKYLFYVAQLLLTCTDMYRYELTCKDMYILMPKFLSWNDGTLKSKCKCILDSLAFVALVPPFVPVLFYRNDFLFSLISFPIFSFPFFSFLLSYFLLSSLPLISFPLVSFPLFSFLLSSFSLLSTSGLPSHFLHLSSARHWGIKRLEINSFP